MTRLSRATLEARLDLAIAALKRAGEPVGGIEVARDGTVRILASGSQGPQDDPLGNWLAQHGNRDEGPA
jgi:hypothetical protein